jgi:hypothetical protein
MQRVLNDLQWTRLSGGRIIWLHPHSSPPTHRKAEKERKLVDSSGWVEEGEGEEPNHTSLVLYKSFNTLWSRACVTSTWSVWTPEMETKIESIIVYTSTQCTYTLECQYPFCLSRTWDQNLFPNYINDQMNKRLFVYYGSYLTKAKIGGKCWPVRSSWYSMYRNTIGFDYATRIRLFRLIGTPN